MNGRILQVPAVGCSVLPADPVGVLPQSNSLREREKEGEEEVREGGRGEREGGGEGMKFMRSTIYSIQSLDNVAMYIIFGKIPY